MRDLPGGPFGLLDSWMLALESERKSPRTLESYTLAVTQLRDWLDEHNHPADDVRAVTPTHVRGWLAHLSDTRSPETCRTRYVGVRQFFTWCIAEDELADHPMANIVQPHVPAKAVPIPTDDDVRRLIADCERGRDFADLRDLALVLLFCDTGARLSGVVSMEEDDLDLRERTARIVLKGGDELVVPFGARTARALDRYLRAKRRRRYGDRRWLWLSSTDKGRLTNNGVQQMLRRRGTRLGIHVHPHSFRHYLADKWLAAGGSEEDLQNIAGWKSRQMVGRYAAGNRQQRARAAHQRMGLMDNL